MSQHSDSPSRFDFYEKVRVVSAEPAKAEFKGKLGELIRKAKGHGGWSYEVRLYGSDQVCHCWEHELESTGEFDSRESFER